MSATASVHPSHRRSTTAYPAGAAAPAAPPHLSAASPPTDQIDPRLHCIFLAPPRPHPPATAAVGRRDQHPPATAAACFPSLGRKQRMEKSISLLLHKQKPKRSHPYYKLLEFLNDCNDWGHSCSRGISVSVDSLQWELCQASDYLTQFYDHHAHRHHVRFGQEMFRIQNCTVDREAKSSSHPESRPSLPSSLPIISILTYTDEAHGSHEQDNKDIYFDDEKDEVVISSLHLEDDQDGGSNDQIM